VSVNPPLPCNDQCIISISINFHYANNRVYKRRMWGFKNANFDDYLQELSSINFDDCFADYYSSGKMIIAPFMYYNNHTKKLAPFPYPPGSKLSYLEYMGTLSGSKYSPTSSSNVYMLYYCNNTRTVGILNPKGNNVLPLPPGKYFSGNTYILGTDDKGHDIWTWLVYGSRVALIVGITAAFVSVMIGTLYGVYSGYRGGTVDTLMMRFVDIMLTIPILPILLILSDILGPSIWNIILIISAFGWAGIARVRGPATEKLSKLDRRIRRPGWLEFIGTM